MRVHIIDHNSVHKALIAKLVVEKLPQVRQITMAKTHEDHSEFVMNADLIIVSGGTWLVDNNPDTHRKLNDLLISSNKPVIGICLGAEALVTYFGGKLERLPDRVKGVLPIDLSPELAQALGKDTCDVYSFHIYAFQELGPELEAVAFSDSGVEAFRHHSMPVWGLQFHPEVRRGDTEGHKIFAYILDEFGLTNSGR